ncbi:hypothetical protein J3D47_002724 [Pseudomonas laurylsulfativorans]|uniref:hypothetical protein n=1 Tax=Pseudomonas laurylsulfativorans TaxID=1943631 RepID=UPI0020A0080F|nr:hypothetical protein [Pseudomonas laurylsulfativorans]MCP1418481.1 hypothetical protein [Pseudomonas laurylsulfativorans]
MSNWFENNQTKSVIGYTLMIIGATWAVSTFVLQDNRINLLKSETDSQKAIAEQYKSKSELLQREIDAIRAENTEYRAWLSQAKDAVPVMVPHLIELKARVAELENRPSGTQTAETHTSEPPAEVYVYRGRAYLDQATGLVFTVLNVDVQRRASIAVKLPSKSAAEELTVYAGWQWKFESRGSEYMLTLTEVNFTGDSVKILLVREAQ